MTDKYIIKLLPWYINDTLDEDENRMVAEALEKDENLKKEYELLKSISTAMQTDEIQTPGEIGLARLKRSMKTSTQSSQQTVQKSSATTRWKFAAIAASLLLIVQVSFTLNQTSEQEYYQPLGSEKKSQDTITVTFSPTATEQQIREVLLASHALIVDGPSAAGIYRVRSTTDIDSTIESLQTCSEVITHVEAE